MLKLRKPTPALVVATIALFVALTGGAFAAEQAIPLHAKNADHAKVADLAKVAAVAKVATTATNALKLGGKTAAQIVASVPAPAPVSSVASLVSSVPVNYSLNATAEQNVTATCPAGSKAMGGGFSNPTNALVLSAGSSPTADGGGWTEDLVNLSDATTATGQVFVTCLK
jgi:hypothetical protein